MTQNMYYKPYDDYIIVYNLINNERENVGFCGIGYWEEHMTTDIKSKIHKMLVVPVTDDYIDMLMDLREKNQEVLCQVLFEILEHQPDHVIHNN